MEAAGVQREVGNIMELALGRMYRIGIDAHMYAVAQSFAKKKDRHARRREQVGPPQAY